MTVISSILRLFGFQKDIIQMPILDYGDPSHDPRNWKKDSLPKSMVGEIYHQPQSNFKAIRLSRYDRQNIIQLFSDQNHLMQVNLFCIEAAGSEGINTWEVNRYVVEKILRKTEYIELALGLREVTDKIHKSRVALVKNDAIGFNKRDKVWYPKAIKMWEQTDKERNFLSTQQLDNHWKRVPNKLEAIKWLYKEFSDDEFEQFCCALLQHCGVVNVQVTEKRKSGADGGLDGIGEWQLDSGIVSFAFEAKRHAIQAQVGSDICQKLAGAMVENNIQHGFIITTAQFSERAKQSIEKMRKNNNYYIELIDQDRMADIMMYKKDSPHGFGLHKTDKGLIYINEEILKRAASKNTSALRCSSQSE